MSEIVIEGCILNFNSLDRQGEIIYADCEVEFPETVPMRYEWGEEPQSWLGFASLEKRKDGVYAKMHFRIEDPAVLEAVKILKPCIGGTVYNKEHFPIFGVEGDVRRKTNLNILKNISINAVGICQINTDYGIKTLGEMDDVTGIERKD